MAAVVFAVGSRPCLSAEDARDLAALLSWRNPVPFRLCDRIRAAAALDADGLPAGTVELDDGERDILRTALDAVLARTRGNGRPAFEYLRQALEPG